MFVQNLIIILIICSHNEPVAMQSFDVVLFEKTFSLVITFYLARVFEWKTDTVVIVSKMRRSSFDMEVLKRNMPQKTYFGKRQISELTRKSK